MAAIDFPASPADGQLFVAPNGITYRWQTTPAPGIWVSVSGGTTPGGDFCATNTAGFTPSTAGVAVGGVLTTIISGNSPTAYFNPATGRYTPPAGRYIIYAFVNYQTASAAALGRAAVMKNGTIVGQLGSMTTGGATFSGMGSSIVTVDANGTDFFEMYMFGQSGGGNTVNAQQAVFGAFPISGIKGPPGDITSPAGDFWAFAGANLSGFTVNVPNVLIANSVGTGNASGSYNVTTGRYTPPLGRFFIFGTCSAAMSAGALQFNINLRKNGVNIPGAVSWETPSNSNYYSTAKINAVVDANGTDFFDLTITPNANPTTVNVLNFGAFPLSGLKGPTGDQGPPGQLGFRLLSRQSLTGPAADINFQNVPADINDLMFSFDVLPSVNDQTFQFQFYNAAGVLDTGANYACSYFQSWNSLANGTAPSGGGGNGFANTAIVMSNYAATAAVGTVSGIRGKGFIPNIKASRPRSVEWSANYTDSAGALNRAVNGSGWRSVSGGITGFRLFFGGGVAIGSTLSVWGSP